MNEGLETFDDRHSATANPARYRPKKRWLLVAKVFKWVLFSATIIGGIIFAAQSWDGNNSGMTFLILAVTVIGALSEFLIFNVLFNLANELMDIQSGISSIERTVSRMERMMEKTTEKIPADNEKRPPKKGSRSACLGDRKRFRQGPLTTDQLTTVHWPLTLTSTRQRRRLR